MNQPPPTPDRMYKYRPWGSEYSDARTFARNMLLRDEFFFSCPASFNDPFDCNANATFTGSEREANKLAIQIASIAYQSDSKEQRRQHIYELLRHIRECEIDREAFTLVATRDVAVCCFSERNDCPLMWGHYADCHRGICVEVTGLRLHPVRYSEELATVDLRTMLPPRGQVDVACALTKYNAWQYEKEWRIIRKGAGPTTLQHPGKITGVITGLQMPLRERVVLRKMLKDAARNIQMYEARKVRGRYGIEIVPT